MDHPAPREASGQNAERAAACTYVLITPARNEAAFIGGTIECVIAQTLKPLKWVIVSDGSTDGTDEIVEAHLAANPWMELVRMPERRERHFGGKALAFKAGWERVQGLGYDIIGNLDADLTFGPDHFTFLVEKFAGNPRLGVGGSPFTEGRGTYDFRFSSIEHVSGACQLFRRECFEAVGGYLPIKGGGIDLVAVVTARMKGWQTRSFPERVCFHHRTMGTGMNQGMRLRFKWGESDYRLGGHPVWEAFRCVYQMRNPPYIVGGLLCLAGYWYAMAAGRERVVSREFAAFRGREQMERLKEFLLRRVSLGAKGGQRLPTDAHH